MLHFQPIDSFDPPELAAYHTMRLPHKHFVERIFVAEGEKVVRRLLESNLDVLSALMPAHHAEAMRPLLEARAPSIRVYTAERPLLERLAGYSMYQGVLAVGRMPEPLALETAWQRSGRPRLFVAMDGLANAENLGAVVRNAVAFGTHALIVGETSSSPYLRRAVRSSMGTVFDLPVVETNDLCAALAQLRTKGMRCVAAHPHTDRRTIAGTDLARDCCLVFGNEGDGIAPAVRAACDECVAIPMPPGVDSLNVASAAAAFLFEANRQRGRM